MQKNERVPESTYLENTRVATLPVQIPRSQLMQQLDQNGTLPHPRVRLLQIVLRVRRLLPRLLDRTCVRTGMVVLSGGYGGHGRAGDSPAGSAAPPFD